MTPEPGDIPNAFIRQAEDCDRLGSPFTAGLCRLLADRLDRRTRFGARILDWPGDPHADRLPLRACGALHALSRSWREPDLKTVYPPAPFNPHMVWTAIHEALQAHDSFLAAYLDSPPQTNEVGRSAIILGAMLYLADAVRKPLDIYEIGASAGLNLGFAFYRYDLGQDRVWGPPDSPLTIPSDWRGGRPPLNAPLRIVGRHACDRNPLDAGNEDDAERLVSYVWPDQAHRLARLETALKLAAKAGRHVDRGDAADWLEHQWRGPPRPGACRVLYHTSVWDYLPADTRARIERTLARAGAEATADSPLAYFSAEPDGKAEGDLLTLTLWPGLFTYRLGRADAHGRWAEWEYL